MIPVTSDGITADFSVVKQPSKTYRMDLDKKIIVGYAYGLEAVKQAVYKILQTERYDWLIYSWNYGSELKSLFGTQMTYAMSETKRMIREALLMDDRITDVNTFEFERNRENLHVTFRVVSTEGTFESGVTVNV